MSRSNPEIFADKAICLDPSAEYRMVELWPKQGTQGANNVSIMLLSKKEKRIIAMDSKRASDLYSEETRLNCSEITFQQWSEVATDKVKDLKWIVRKLITNKVTIQTIEDQHKALGFPLDRRGEFTPSKTDKKDDNALK